MHINCFKIFKNNDPFLNTGGVSTQLPENHSVHPVSVCVREEHGNVYMCSHVAVRGEDGGVPW